MADNTTLYIIIGVALLLAFMNANSQQSNTGAPALSAYLRRRATMPEFIEHVPTMPQVLERQKQYIRAKHATLPQYIGPNLGARPQFIDNRQGNPVFNRL